MSDLAHRSTDPTLDGLAETIRREYQRGRDSVVDALEAQFAIGHALLAARRLLPSNQAFGTWCTAQDFEFTRQWANMLYTAADREIDVRAALETQVSNGDAPNIKSALKLIRARDARAIEQRARATSLDELAVDASGDGWRLMAGDFRERLAELPVGCVDLIVTDPPYPTEFLPLYSDLSKIARHVLADDGICAVLAGKINFPDLFDRLREDLTYGWIYCQPLPGSNSRIMGRHVFQAWKPWLAFTKGTWPSARVDWHVDMLDPSSRAKDQYRWQQDGDPAKLLIDALCPEGGTICDPLAGTGSYGVAAVEMGRKFIGCELDSARFETARQNLDSVVLP